MQIFIKTLEGQTHTVELQDQQTAFDCKQYIAQQEGVNQDLINLVCQGSILKDSDILCETLQAEQTIYVTAGLDGGKKKKKKKPKTTPKKNKHKHKPTKLHTLQYYSVDGSGKITFARKLCVQCPPGVFMAKHFDRHYCGRCHVSLKLDPKTIEINKKELEKKLAAKRAALATGVVDSGKPAPKEAKKGKDAKKKGKK